MARVTVEGVALHDPRFRIAGDFLRSSIGEPFTGQAVGLYLAALVWHWATEQGTDTVPGAVLRAIHPEAPAALEAGFLAESVDGDRWRIKGAAGRLDWLAKKRESNRARQARYRRVSNALQPDTSRVLQGGALALALAPALAPEKKKERGADRVNDAGAGTELPDRKKTSIREPTSLLDRPVLVFPTKTDVKHWALTASQIERWRELYPGSDVLAMCRDALAYVEARPDKRKTPKGMPDFLRRWISSDSDSGKRSIRRNGRRGGLSTDAEAWLEDGGEK